MDHAERGCHSRGILTACGSGAGSDFRCRPKAESVKGPVWAPLGQALSGLVDRSNVEGAVRTRAAGRAIVPGRCWTGFARASPGADAG